MKKTSFKDYANLIRQLLQQGLQTDTPPMPWPTLGHVQQLMLDAKPEALGKLAEGLHRLSDSPRLPDEGREVLYHLLCMHVHLAAFQIHYETLSSSDWATCDEALVRLMQPLREIEAYVQIPAPHACTDRILWEALCLLEMALLQQRDVDVEMADCVIHQIAERQVRSGALCQPGPDESPDGWIYRELAGLHALANAALLRRNVSWSIRVEQIAAYHQENTQSDHCTSEPWALFAFLWPDRTRPFGEQQLHACQAYGLTAMSRVLLADAARCLKCFDPIDSTSF